MSKSKAVIECIKEYFKGCPSLNKLSKINVDYLNTSSNDGEYWSIEPIEAPVILGKNILGTKIHKQCQFIVASRMFFDPINDTQNIKNLQVFDEISDWIYSNNKKHIFPQLSDDETPTGIEVILGGNLYGVDKTNTIARYQMTCKLLYDKEEKSIWH